ncbi:MAG: DUF559 domain-containing protein [Bacteroidia bacterium]|nr:DUF559 domain-containing protein [Bacteroidia bacterium]
MKQNQIHNLPDLKEMRRWLRKRLTPAELLLWNHLKNKKLECRKFRRQHCVGKYVLDFYCPTEKLAIELDGSPHFTEEGKEHDKKEQNILIILALTLSVLLIMT